jgi:fatty acid desaturase
MPLYMRGGIGPLRYSHRLTGRPRRPYVPVGIVAVLVVCAAVGALCLALGMPWWVVAGVLVVVVLRNAVARRR